MLYNWPNWWQPVVKRLFRPLHIPMLWPDSVKSRSGSGSGSGAYVLWRGWVLLVLLLQSHAALALGLGNIRVLSQPGEPLIAEIPLLSNNPEELDGATATLASTDTFKRVGLPTPRGQVRELQFAFAQDHNERAVIRVSTTTPIQVPALSFLIEVNWAQGRIVREYSTLVSTPETLTALSEPPIELPQGAQSDLIVREMEPAYDPLVMPLADDIWKDIAEQIAEKSPIGTEVEAESAFTIIPSTPKPPARSTRSPTPPSRFNSGAIDGQQVTVQRGQTLGQIAGELARKNGQSLDQTMIAMLRANPQAFINGNLNLLREGAVLRVPNQDELNQLNAVQANAMVREHMTQWQQYRGPILQPAVATVSQPEPAITTVSIETPSPQPPSNDDARLEIAPAVTANQPNAQSTTGLEAGGTGNQLGLSAGGLLEEELASREAELQELRERVSALEALQKKQQALIELKDSDLAAAQQRLAEVVETPSEAGWGIWLVGGLLLLALASGGAWLLRRRNEPALAFEDEDFSELFGLNDAEAETDPAELNDSLPAEEMDNLPASESDKESTQQIANQASSQADQSWSNTTETPDEALPEEPITDPRERLELAVAYLDLGDTRTARNLLNEVATGPDPKLRKEALELLERLNWIN